MSRVGTCITAQAKDEWHKTLAIQVMTSAIEAMPNHGFSEYLSTPNYTRGNSRQIGSGLWREGRAWHSCSCAGYVSGWAEDMSLCWISGGPFDSQGMSRSKRRCDDAKYVKTECWKSQEEEINTVVFFSH